MDPKDLRCSESISTSAISPQPRDRKAILKKDEINPIININYCTFTFSIVLDTAYRYNDIMRP